jgi:hypothetical protein
VRQSNFANSVGSPDDVGRVYPMITVRLLVTGIGQHLAIVAIREWSGIVAMAISALLRKVRQETVIQGGTLQMRSAKR